MAKCDADEKMGMVTDIVKRWGSYQLTDHRAMGAIAIICGAEHPTPANVEWAVENASTLRLAIMAEHMGLVDNG